MYRLETMLSKVTRGYSLYINLLINNLVEVTVMSNKVNRKVNRWSLVNGVVVKETS